MSKEITEEEKKKVEDMINSLVERVKKVSEKYKKLDQDQVNKIVKAMSLAGEENHMNLAKMAVEETGRGIYEDKITKNMFATVNSERFSDEEKEEKLSQLRFTFEQIQASEAEQINGKKGQEDGELSSFAKILHTDNNVSEVQFKIV